MRALLWLCGMEDKGPAEPGSSAEPAIAIASLEERPLVKGLLDINLVLCMGCGVFLWGYFA